MRLSALRWNVAGVLEPEDKKRAARNAGTFYKEPKSQSSKTNPLPPVHSTLADIADRDANGNLEVTLKLVVT